MAKRLIETFHGRPLLDISSYARRGPGERDGLSPAQVDLIRRTVTRTPEVMVKILARGTQNLKAVRAHIAYLHRHGDLEIETDQGERLIGKDVEYMLVEDWDLDVDEHRRRAELRSQRDRVPPKVVHKILFSMPPGTSSKKVLAAVRNFAREEFGLKHRYALVLHTDEPHPHVHMVVKAVSERGVRLNIRKDTLRRWRETFASELRRIGVPANATERAVRGEIRAPLPDPIYRAGRRGDSRVLNRSSQNSTDSRQRLGLGTLRDTREHVRRGWYGLEELLRESDRHSLASQVAAFVDRMPGLRTSNEVPISELVSSRATRTVEPEQTR